MKEYDEIGNRRKTAVALGYQVGVDAAPRVLAKGKGFIAEKIIEIAREHHIPLRFNQELSSMLYHVSLNETIPGYLYEVVAGVLAWVYSIDAKTARRHENNQIIK